ncbi:MAG: redoxin family protein [Pirellulales bacterium]|nr:redoxin family protein [Pirellulales bacterium]
MFGFSRRSVAVVLLGTLAGCAPDEPAANATAPQATAANPAPQTDSGTAIDPAALATLDEAGWARFLAEQHGKVVFLDCWATWCGTCKEQFPHTVALHRKLADRGLVVVAVAFDEADAGTRRSIAEFLQAQGAHFPAFINAHGSDDAAYTMLGVENSVLPHYQVIDRNGQVVKKFLAGDPTSHLAKPEEIEAAVVAALEAPAAP